MKYCPYCGAEAEKEDYVFCLECGKALAEYGTETDEKKSNKRQRIKKGKNSKKKRKKTGKHVVPEVAEPSDDGYDGYYDDRVPVDEGKLAQEIDKTMLKRIIGLCIGVLITICACVAIMYML